MKVSQLTDIGLKRKANQDQIGTFSNRSQQTLLLLCDGMGGHNAGDVASEMAIFDVGKAWEKTEKMVPVQAEEWLKIAIESANNRIVEVSKEYIDLEGMGTTIVAIAVLGQKALVAHVGDSRAYQVDDGKLIPITKDHSFVQELLDRHIITAEEAQNHPQKNIVTQSVGVNDAIKIDTHWVSLQEGERLLLCSDGLTDMLTDEEITPLLNQETDLNQAAEALIQAANQAGGKDNISVILAEIERGDLL